MHYLDNSATTRVSKTAADKAYEIMTEIYGNPSSLHLMGMNAEKELELARKRVSAALGATSEELFFTSGGTEANNTALFGAAYAKRRSGKRIVISSVEHSSVLEAAARLEQEGFEVVRIAPQIDGIIHPEDVAEAVNDDTILVSVMLVNNETGAVMPVKDIFEAARDKNDKIICHTDAVQAFGKLDFSPKKLGADLLSVSAHKVHAPKGCGALYIKRRVRIIPRQFGGEQEKKIRPGTEALPLIAAFGAACEEFDVEGNGERVAELNGYARQRLLEIGGVVINSPENALPYVLNISAGRVRSETMLHFLEEREVFVSSGSACAKGKPSHVLGAMGIDRDRADSALRISFSKLNTKADVDALCEGIAEGLGTLAHR
ncbi:MAG: cysteine desulfurase family protein [Ruminococcus sp.]|nr:cysteine desulfurase family protein [Ruminococcus sp.]